MVNKVAYLIEADHLQGLGSQPYLSSVIEKIKHRGNRILNQIVWWGGVGTQHVSTLGRVGYFILRFFSFKLISKQNIADSVSGERKTKR